jgi:hypothetical protein
MILIFKQKIGEIIGADKDFLEKYSIEELNKTFSNKINNLDKLKNEEEYKNYNIESIPIKDYKIIFFMKENNKQSILNNSNETNDLSLDFDTLIPNEVDNTKANENSSIDLDNILNKSVEPTNETNDLSLDFANLIPNEVDNTKANENSSIDLDNILNKSVEPDNEKKNINLENNHPKENKNNKKVDIEQNSKKVILNINFDIESIKRKKQGNS